jgi:hypothetical protein
VNRFVRDLAHRVNKGVGIGYESLPDSNLNRKSTMFFAHDFSRTSPMFLIASHRLRGSAKSAPARLFGAAALMAAFIVPSEAKAGNLVLSAEAAGVEATTRTNVVTESFNGFAPSGGYTSLNSSIGTFTSSGMAIVSANQYGGAGGTGNYFAIGAESGSLTATLTLTAPQAYFGFEWNAADPYNKIEFFSGSSSLGVFDPTTALGALGSDYFGNPNNRNQDSSEKFAYINVTDTVGPQITSIVFTNTTYGTGFEIDNMSVSVTNTTPPGSTVIAGGIATAAVPEPSSLVLLGLSLGLGAGVFCLRQRGDRKASRLV